MRASISSCANACCKIGGGFLYARFLGVGFLCLAACGETGALHPSNRANDDAAPLAATDAVAIPTAVADAAAATERDASADPYGLAAPVTAKSIGHTSYVLKLRLEGGLLAAYKPQSTLPLGDRRYRGEIAAYRLGQALGLPNVPRAIPRSFAASALAQAFSTPVARLDFERKARVDPEGRVRGALIPWIDGYEELPLEQRPWQTKWIAWLTREDSAPEGEERIAAGAISTLLAFDYLTANWDRWSGGNVARDRAGTILFVDNDGAFYERPPADDLARQLARLRRVVRFSRSFVAALRSLDDAALREALGNESPGRALLPDGVIAGVAARRATLLQLIDARIASAGDEGTLAFD